MNPYLLLTIFLFLSACQSTIPPENAPFYMPAEYEAHEAVWLGWYGFGPYYQPFLDVAEALYDHVPLKIVARSAEDLAELQDSLTGRKMNLAQITFHIMEDNRLWIRDHGATYVVNDSGDKRVIDFGWTLYGHEEFLMGRYGGNIDSVAYYYQQKKGKTGLIDSLMGNSDGWGSLKTDLNMEGGSIEVNGKGTLILCETVTTQRNPSLSKTYIESEFKRLLGVSHIIWMKQGLADDPYKLNRITGNYFGWGTYGHTDEFVRFVNDSTILLAWVNEEDKDSHPIHAINYERMSENLAILQAARDQDGKPFKIVKVPLPAQTSTRVTVVEELNGEWDKNLLMKWVALQPNDLEVGDTVQRVPASSYLNYLVTNDIILLPTYLKEGTPASTEQEVIDIFETYFPERELRFIEPMNLNYFGGGIHCITQQEPVAIGNRSARSQ